MEKESQIKLFRPIASKLCLLVIVMLAYHYSSKVLETIILKKFICLIVLRLQSWAIGAFSYGL